MVITLNLGDLPTSTFACGPSQGHPALRQTPLSKTLFERSHRADDISTHGLYQQATENLRTLLQVPAEYTISFFMGGGVGAMDAVLWSLTKNSLSGLSFGEFSHRWSTEMAERLEPQVVRHIVRAQAGEFFPRQKPNLKDSLVVLTPNETSTGVQIPNDYLHQAWKEKGDDTLIAWDCTSCAGGRDLPQKEYDVMLFSLQKCFGVGGGTSVLILSPAARARLEEVKKYRRIPYALDVSFAVEKARKFQTSNTPSTTNIWLLNQACQWMNDHGGIQAMDALCRVHADYLVHWAQQSDFVSPLIQDEKFRSYTTLTLEVTDPRIQAEEVSRALAATGRPNLADGIKKHPYVKQNSFRIACFPFVDIHGTGEYEKLTHAIDEIVRQLRQK